MKRGDIWWARLAPPDKTRPVVLVTRDEGIARRRYVTVVPVTTRARDIPTEVALGSTEGLRHVSVANCDDLRTIPKDWLLEKTGALSPARVHDLDAALTFALALD